jgi:hypothetical protein
MGCTQSNFVKEQEPKSSKHTNAASEAPSEDVRNTTDGEEKKKRQKEEEQSTETIHLLSQQEDTLMQSQEQQQELHTTNSSQQVQTEQVKPNTMDSQDIPSAYIFSLPPTYDVIFETIKSDIEALNKNHHYHCHVTTLDVESKEISLELYIDPIVLLDNLSEVQIRAYGIDTLKYITVTIGVSVPFMYTTAIEIPSVSVFQSGNVSTKEYNSNINKSFLLICNIIECDVQLLLKNKYLPNFYSDNNRNNINILFENIKYSTIHSYEKCMITGRKIEPKFRCYMQNKPFLFEHALNSKYADQLVKYYIEKEPHILEYILISGVGPESNEDEYKYYDYSLYPDTPYIPIEGHDFENYDCIRAAWFAIPSVKNLILYSEQGLLEKNLNEANPTVS